PWSWHTAHPGHSCSQVHISSRSHAKLASHLRPFALAGAHLAYHHTHFIKLLNQLVDLLDGRTTATSNTFAPASIEDLGIASLLFSHGEDNRLDMFHLVAFERFLHLWRRCQFVQARDHLHDLTQWTHAFQLTHGAKKIFQVKFTLL